MTLTAIVQPDVTPSGIKGYSSHCPELDIGSQGETAEEARLNLREALELFFQDADPEEIQRRLELGATVSQLEMAA